MSSTSRFEAFYLPVQFGKRFAIFYPSEAQKNLGTFVYIHPFAEEMNKSRRMAALQARAFAKLGYSVFLIDLYGCGDSDGDLSEATWEIWKQDISSAIKWLSVKETGQLHLWGLRLGATLGLDIWQDSPEIFESALLWQPVTKGETFMTQFLRLAIAGEALRDVKGGLTTTTLRQQLSAGEVVEVAGYPLTGNLIKSIDTQKAENFYVIGKTIHWLDVKTNIASGTAPATQNLIEKWKAKGINVNYQLVEGDSFWGTQEIVDVPALIDISCNIYSA